MNTKNTSNPFLPSPADTVIDMPRDGHGLQHRDGDLLPPVPGQSLFSEYDHGLFDSFFHHISSDLTSDTNFGEGLNFSDQWVSHYQPPQAVLGHQTHPSNTSMNSILNSLNPIGFESFIPDFGTPIPPQQLSADVLGAAHVLSRPGVPSNHQHQNQHQNQYYDLPHDVPNGLPQIPTSMGPPMNNIQNSQYPHFANTNAHSQRHAATVHRLLGNGYTDMYHSVAPPLPPSPRPAPPPEISFGTDTGFTGSNFTTSNGETNIEKRIFDRQNSILDCLERNTSAAPTRASSPQHNGGGGSGGGHENGDGDADGEITSPLKLRTRQYSIPHFEPDNSNQPPTKRRKSKPKASPDEDDVAEFDHFDAVARTPGRAARGSTGSISRSRPPNGSSPVEEPLSAGGRRRRGQGPPPKPPRENLTEAQKRENHIKSEQKRRTLIKDGFDDIQEIVPELKGSGLSKSVILTAAGDYLDRVLAGNSDLLKKLGRT